MFNDSDIPVIELNNNIQYLPSDPGYKIIKYKGPSHDSNYRKIKKIRFNTSIEGEIKIDELQIWAENENKISSNIDAPNYSFILNGSNNSLTSLYSSDSLILVNSPTLNESGLLLNGSNQYVTIPQSIGNFGTNEFAISIWMKHTNISSGLPGSEGSPIFSPGYNNSNSFWFGRGPSDNKLHLFDLSTSVRYDSNPAITITVDDVIHNYVITKASNTVRVFADGVKIIEYNRTAAFPTSDYHVGYSSPRGKGGGIFQGYIYRIDIWKERGFSS